MQRLGAPACAENEKARSTQQASPTAGSPAPSRGESLGQGRAGPGAAGADRRGWRAAQRGEAGAHKDGSRGPRQPAEKEFFFVAQLEFARLRRWPRRVQSSRQPVQAVNGAARRDRRRRRGCRSLAGAGRQHALAAVAVGVVSRARRDRKSRRRRRCRRAPPARSCHLLVPHRGGLASERVQAVAAAPRLQGQARCSHCSEQYLRPGWRPTIPHAAAPPSSALAPPLPTLGLAVTMPPLPPQLCSSADLQQRRRPALLCSALPAFPPHRLPRLFSSRRRSSSANSTSSPPAQPSPTDEWNGRSGAGKRAQAPDAFCLARINTTEVARTKVVRREER